MNRPELYEIVGHILEYGRCYIDDEDVNMVTKELKIQNIDFTIEKSHRGYLIHEVE